jgi:hypothetical protein
MEPVEPLGPDARDLLATYRRERPGAHGRARNWPGVRTRVDAPVRRPASPLWFGGLALVLAAAVLLLVHALFVAWQATQLERTTTTPSASDIVPEPPVDDVHVRAPTPVALPAVQTPAAVSAPTPAIEPPPLQRPRAAARATTDTPASPDPTEAELELVACARTAVADGDLSTALAMLDEHARRFPKGALAEERAAYRAIVLCRSGAADAPTARLEFESRYPGSHHHRSINAACDARGDSPAP